MIRTKLTPSNAINIQEQHHQEREIERREKGNKYD